MIQSTPESSSPQYIPVPGESAKARNLRLKRLGLKHCPSCKQDLPLETFGFFPSRSDGLGAYCHECSKAVKRMRSLASAIEAVSKDRNCWYCGVELTVDTHTVDHVVPRVKGGTDDPSNCVPACMSCNTSKKNQSLEEFRALRARQRDGVPYFNPKQLRYLEAHGIELPKSEPFVFWFEKEGKS